MSSYLRRFVDRAVAVILPLFLACSRRDWPRTLTLVCGKPGVRCFARAKTRADTITDSSVAKITCFFILRTSLGSRADLPLRNPSSRRMEAWYPNNSCLPVAFRRDLEGTASGWESVSDNPSSLQCRHEERRYSPSNSWRNRSGWIRPLALANAVLHLTACLGTPPKATSARTITADVVIVYRALGIALATLAGRSGAVSKVVALSYRVLRGSRRTQCQECQQKFCCPENLDASPSRFWCFHSYFLRGLVPAVFPICKKPFHREHLCKAPIHSSSFCASAVPRVWCNFRRLSR